MINHIASIPIGVYENINFSEHEYFYNLEYHDEDPYFSRSKNSRILEKTNLKSWIQEKLNDYCYNALATTEKLKITQSWCLKHENRYSEVYLHTHPNSILSGAYYIECDKNSSYLELKSPSIFASNQLEWCKKEELLKDQSWLWKNYQIYIKKGLLVLFPSNIEHRVHRSSLKDNRCVLSFNTWFENDMGSEKNLTLLKVS